MKTEILKLLRTIATHKDDDCDKKDENGKIIKHRSTHLQSLSEEQFICILPLLCQKIDELKLEDKDYYVFSAEQKRKLRKARIKFVWQIFCKDWRSKTNKTFDGELIIGSFIELIEIPLNFRICFMPNQKQRLPS